MAQKITSAQVQADFDDPVSVVHYARAAHFLGLWASERILIGRFFPDHAAPLLEAGCGAGRVTLGLWELGYRDLTAFDFAAEPLAQARHLATERGAAAIRFLQADATQLSRGAVNLTASEPPERGQVDRATPGPGYSGALFLFNGLMQIPGRDGRRAALRGLRAVCAPGAPLLFTTHDREHSPAERALWRLEALRWERGEQDERLVEFGDRYFEDEAGRTFMHLPDRAETLADLAATGWVHELDSLRREVANESRAVREFSDECRFWLARNR
ncbi:MAG: class I SAM-dependent methyltransferase [Verrucomicrobiota bacterium]